MDDVDANEKLQKAQLTKEDLTAGVSLPFYYNFVTTTDPLPATTTDSRKAILLLADNRMNILKRV